MEDYIGRYVKIFLKNGIIFHGSVLLWGRSSSNPNDQVKLKSIQNEIIVIQDIKDICAYIFIQKPDGKFLVDENVLNKEEINIENKEEINIENKEEINKEVLNIKDKTKSRVNELASLYKLKAESERQLAKNKLKTSTLTASPVEYGDTISILRTLKNNSSE